MAKSGTVMIPAVVQLASPERAQFKPYRTELSFENKVIVEIPVPAEHVKEGKDGTFVLSLQGWTIFLDVYATEVEKMDNKVQSDKRTNQSHKPY